MMRLSVPVVLCGAALIMGAHDAARAAEPEKGAASVAARLAGAWRLVSIETVQKNGEVTYPFYGKHPEGLIIYDRSGWMSVQIVSDPKPMVPAVSSRGDFLAAPAAEKVAAIDGYYAYCGRWTVDERASTVTHHLQQSLYPGERGQEFVRQVSIKGNRLTLVAKIQESGQEFERRLVWERAPEATK